MIIVHIMLKIAMTNVILEMTDSIIYKHMFVPKQKKIISIYIHN